LVVFVASVPFAAKLEPDMVEQVVDELAIRLEPGVAPVTDVIAGHLVPALVGMLPTTPRSS
jgi:hypothetical protein